MKKHLFYLAAVGMIMSLLQSCINDNENTNSTKTCAGFVTINHSGTLLPDLCNGLTLAVSSASQSQLGMDQYERAYIIYEIPAATTWTYGENKSITPNIVSVCYQKIQNIAENTDTLDDYKGSIYCFNGLEGQAYSGSTLFTTVIPGYTGYTSLYPGIYVSNGYLNLFFVNETTGDAVLKCESIDQLTHTAYMKLLTKSGNYTSTPCIQSYALSSSEMLDNLSPDATDSINIVISANTNLTGDFSYTLRCAK